MRVRSTGNKSYELVYRNEAGRRRRLKLGDASKLPLADARQKAKELLLLVIKGEDLSQTRRDKRNGLTVADLVADYIELHAEPKLKPRSIKDIKYEARSSILPALGNLKIADVRRYDIVKLIEDIGVRKAAPVRANHVRTLISGIFNFAVQRGILDASPSVGLPPKFKEVPRDRFLEDDEIIAFWKATETEAVVIRELFRFLLLLGQRSYETRQMRWDQIKDGIWTIPANVTKNGIVQVVPLPQRALESLILLRNPTPYVFSSANSHISSIHKATFRLKQKMGSDARWTPHDLRRTCATQLEKLGVDQSVIAAILNHSKLSALGVTGRYVRHNFEQEKKIALTTWSSRLAQLTSTNNETNGNEKQA